MKRLLMAFLACFMTLCAWAQGAQGDGTALLDDLDSKDRVVVDAFANASNKIHSLIQEVSPKPDLEGFAKESDLLAFYYPEGGVTSMEQITTNGIEYAVGSDGGAYVVSGNGLSGDVVLPWKVNIGGKEYKVTAIGESAFGSDSYNDSFANFIAPITVKNIGRYAFLFLSSLKSASIPSVTNIEANAFHHCRSLESVNFPSVKSIENNAFHNCRSLKSAIFPSATSVGDGAFLYCSSLTTIDFPSAVSIRDGAFSDCYSLTTVNLPSATSIGGGAFSYCDSLTSVSLPSATSIGGSTFDVCSSLTTVYLPSVTNIMNYAFNYCSSLTTIDFGSSPKSTIPSLSEFAFTEIPNTCKFIIPLGMYDEWIVADGWSNLYSRGYKFDGYASASQNVGVPNVSATGSVVRVGANATTATTNSIALGHDAKSDGTSTFVTQAELDAPEQETLANVEVGDYGAVAEGYRSKATGNGAVAIAPLSEAKGNGALSVGRSSSARGGRAIAIGDRAIAKGQDAIQIGNGTNTDTNSLNVLGFKFMKPDGTIPHERITGLSNGSETRTADSLFRSMDNQNMLWTYVYGETVWIAVTNYMRTVHGVAPSFQLWEIRDGRTNCVYWSAEEIDVRVGDKIDVAMSNVAHSVATSKADRAWSKYQSMTGADNPQPNDVTIVSTPSIMLSGGYEWQRFVDTGAEVWVLKCNDLITLGADTNAYFRITDLEGETQFAIEKTASRLVDAVPTATGFTTDGNNYFKVTFSGNIQPTIYVSPELVSSFFIECNATENEHGLSCTWEHDAAANTYTATIAHNAGDGKPSRMFVYGKVLQEGSTVVKHTAPSSFDGGIIINGVQYSVGTATIDGKTVMTLNTVTRAVNE